MSLRRPQENLRLTCPSCEQKLDASAIPAFEQVACPNCEYVFSVPFRFGQYLLEEAIEESRIAGVYRGQDLKLRREVAIKVLFEELARDGTIVDLFLGAARRTAILNHINILPIYSCDCYEGMPYIVMEYMVGTCLHRTLQQLDSLMSVVDGVHFCEMAARGLDAANHEDINHDGLRPTNVLWDGSNTIKISDFGMYEFKRSAAEQLGLDWRAFFHSGYTSPEILRGETTGGVPGDIFGLGTTLYHLLTGHRPFSNTVESRMASIEGMPPPPMELRPEIPAELSEYVMKMIAFQPSDRPRTYREVISTFFNLREQLEDDDNSTVSPPPETGKRTLHAKRVLVGRPVGASHRLGTTRRRRKRSVFVPVLLMLTFCAFLGIGSTLAIIFRQEIIEALGFTPPEVKKEVIVVDDPGIDGNESDSPDRVDRPAPFENRPMPVDLDFSPDNAEVRSYLTALPRPLRRKEMERVKVLAQVRPHIQQLIASLPYQGSKGIRLRSGRVLQGTVPLCDASGFSVNESAGNTIQIAWSEISPYQYGIFLEFYIEQRKGQGNLSPGERVALARDYLMLALVCDWMKDDRRAKLYAGEAISTDEETGQRVRELLPYLDV